LADGLSTVQPMPNAAAKAVVNTNPRSAWRLVTDAFGLYRRYPWLFFALAAAVAVPFELVVLAAIGSGADKTSHDAGLGLLLIALELALVTPLISALHIHAVVAVREGREPQIGRVARQGLAVLPVVAAVSIMSWLGIVVGFIALVVPGVILTLRWYVVAQTAAIEDEGWVPALRRSATLTSGNYGRVFLLLLFASAITLLPALLVELAFDDSTGPAAFLVGVLVQIFAWSFTALTTALLYLDLRARRQLLLGEAATGSTSPPGPTPPTPPTPPTRHDPSAHSWDPRAYSDEERPFGWYPDPDNPHRMRYWGEGDPPGWGKKTVRTPSKIRAALDERG
jgi:hypothetical protein